MPKIRVLKPLVRTDYCVRRGGYKTPKFLDGAGVLVSFKRAAMFPTRRDAIDHAASHAGGWEIVGVRGRALSARTKASGKRTK